MKCHAFSVTKNYACHHRKLVGFLMQLKECRNHHKEWPKHQDPIKP